MSPLASRAAARGTDELESRCCAIALVLGGPQPAPCSDFSLLCHLERVIDLDAQIAAQ